MDIAMTNLIRFDLKLTLRILIVTDGAINLWDIPAEPAGQGSNEGFTLRETARALWDAPGNLYPYARFVVDHAIHGTGPMTVRSRSETDPEGGKIRAWTEYDEAQFDNPNLRLKNYDQLWFFGFWPGNPDANDNFTVPHNRVPLNPREIDIIAAWMNAGGGVFATGDHGLLGSHLCGDVIRVKQMRRWRTLGISDPVPSSSDLDRIDTIVPVRTKNGQLEVEFDDQSDNTPKPLRLKRYLLWNGGILEPSNPVAKAFQPWAPHPVLCSPIGPIDILPDHMHEGLVREDTEVELGEHESGNVAEFPGGARRPTPEVIAWSTVRGDNISYQDSTLTPSVIHRVVPTISVYDGAQVKVGRIVVDSTFHNWLDINVRGVGAGGHTDPQTGAWVNATGLEGKNRELVHYYVRNIAQWLASPESRDAMRNGLFLHVVTNTAGWSQIIHNPVIMGERARSVLGQTISVCEQRGIVFEPWMLETFRISRLVHSGHLTTLPSSDIVSRHVLGAMVQAVFELLPKLADHRQSNGDADTMEEFKMISHHLDAARRAGVISLTAEWRSVLETTAGVLDAMERSVQSRADPARPEVGR
jgi:hypothetical protein